MRAVQYVGDGGLRVATAEVAPPPPGSVQLEVAYTGICGTDLHIVHGAMDGRVARPAVLGHEAAGRIAELGDGVEDWSAGDPVTVVPLVSCGTCYACLNGAAHICYRLTFLGIDAPGSMQERWNVPAEVLVRLPPSLPLESAALAEPAAVAVHDVRRSALTAGERAVVVGAGPIGLLIAAVARTTGANVAVVEPNELRRETAEALGFTVLDPASEPAEAWVEDWTDGAGAEVSFEVSGTEAGTATALAVLAARGRAVVVGIQAQPPRVELFRVFWRELVIVGARVYERADFEQAVELLARGQLPADVLISSVEPFERAEHAFRELEQGRALKILLGP